MLNYLKDIKDTLKRGRASFRYWWIFEMKPRLTNPIRILKFKLNQKAIKRYQREHNKNSSYYKIFYGDGSIPDQGTLINSGSYGNRSLYDWWIKNSKSEEVFVKYHIQAIRRYINKKK